MHNSLLGRARVHRTTNPPLFPSFFPQTPTSTSTAVHYGARIRDTFQSPLPSLLSSPPSLLSFLLDYIMQMRSLPLSLPSSPPHSRYLRCCRRYSLPPRKQRARTVARICNLNGPPSWLARAGRGDYLLITSQYDSFLQKCSIKS